MKKVKKLSNDEAIKEAHVLEFRKALKDAANKGAKIALEFINNKQVKHG